VAEELPLDWHTVKALDMQYMEAQLKRLGTPGPRVIGVDEISIRKDPGSWSATLCGRPIWFSGEDRSEAITSQFYAWLRDFAVPVPHGERAIRNPCAA
jgi:transposase